MIPPKELSKDSGNTTAQAPAPPGQPSVLLVEDDRALRRYLEVVLERAGYRVIVAADGLEAMRAALTTPVDVVVTDAIMPNLNGHELCRFLRSTPQLSKLPVVLLSALRRKEIKSEAARVDAYLFKPVSPEDLLECLEQLLGSAKP
jgi:CheY-like chemotaxis protein